MQLEEGAIIAQPLAKVAGTHCPASSKVKDGYSGKPRVKFRNGLVWWKSEKKFF